MSSTTQVKRAHPHIKHTVTEKKVHVRTEAGDSVGWISRSSPLVALHKRLSKGFRWIFGLKEKKFAQSEGGKSPEVQILANDGSRRQESAPETEFKKRNLASSISTSSKSLVTESEEGSVEESKESTQASESDPQPAKKESPVNTPRADQRRPVAISEGSQNGSPVSQLLQQTLDSVDPDKLKIEDSASYITVSALIAGSFDDANVEPPPNIKLVTNGHLDEFIRRLGALVSPNTIFEAEVEWDYSVDVQSQEVTAQYRLRPKEDGRGGLSLEGDIRFAIDGSDWQLDDPCLLGPDAPQGWTKAKDDPMGTLVSSRSSSEEGLGTIEIAQVIEYVGDPDDAGHTEDAGRASTSSDKDLNLPMSALQTGTADDSASESIDEPVLLKKPKSLKKNPLAAAIRGKAWDLKETVGQSVKETASDIRAGAWDGKENAKDSVKQAAKTIAENLKSDVQREAEDLYGEDPTADDLNKARIRQNKRKRQYGEVVGHCIPKEMGVTDPVSFLKLMTGPLATKATLKKFQQGLLQQHRTALFPKTYAEGVLGCHKGLMDGDHEFVTNKANWLPNGMQAAYVAAGSPPNVTAWLEELIEIRKTLKSIDDDKSKGVMLDHQIKKLDDQCQTAKVKREWVENTQLSFREALSYAIGWKTAFERAKARDLI